MLRFVLAVLMARLAYYCTRLLGRKGTTLSGAVALKLDPAILAKLARQLELVIFVTGTNGKTTTSNLLAHMLRSTGRTVIHNAEGSNMLNGIASAMLKQADWRGSLRGDCAVLEVDEGSMPAVLRQVSPHYVVILNFFRDQLDRYGEIDVLINSMIKALEPVHPTLILNTDDPLVMQFDELPHPKVYVGLRTHRAFFGHYASQESVFCPRCGSEMAYTSIHFGQLGDYRCTCGFARKPPHYEAEILQSQPNLMLQINDRHFPTALKGNFNTYNILASSAAAMELGVQDGLIQQVLMQYPSNNGRMETFQHRGYPYILNLNKNPSGTNVMLHEVMADPAPKQLLILLNDNVADGEDVSWIWDVDFEVLLEGQVERIICSGTRSSEIALRLSYAGFDSSRILDVSIIPEAIETVIRHPMRTYVLPTYTALEPSKKSLGDKVSPL